MPLDNRITRERVYEIAETLRGEGKPQTIEAIKQAHGGGSSPTICKYLRAWKDENGQNKIPSPSQAKEAMSDATAAAWLSDLAGREAKLKAEYALVIEDKEQMLQSLLAEAETTAAQIAIQTEEIARLTSELAARTAETATAQKAAEAAEAGRLEAQATANRQAGVIEELRGQIDRLTGERNKAQALAETTLEAIKALTPPGQVQESAKTKGKKKPASGSSTPESGPTGAGNPEGMSQAQLVDAGLEEHPHLFEVPVEIPHETTPEGPRNSENA